MIFLFSGIMTIALGIEGAEMNSYTKQRKKAKKQSKRSGKRKPTKFNMNPGFTIYDLSPVESSELDKYLRVKFARCLRCNSDLTLNGREAQNSAQVDSTLAYHDSRCLSLYKARQLRVGHS